MAKKTAKITPLTRDQVRDICFRDQKQGIPKSGIGECVRGDFSEKISGKEFCLKFVDAEDIDYKIISGEKVSWKVGRNNFKEEYAQILELDSAPGLYLLNHIRGGTFPLQNVTLILDTTTNLATLILAELGDSARPRDVERNFYFASIKTENGYSPLKKHNFSTDLVGKIIDWHYDFENEFVVKHLYANNEHMVYLLLEAKDVEKGLLEAAECDYIKIRDNVYVMSWLEKGHQGMQGVALMDISAMHDVGSFFGINIGNRLDSYTFAARGEFSDLGHQII